MKSNKIVNNVKWIVICKAAQAVLQLLIGMLTARYLGPANYGLINYAKSVVAFAVPITKLGLDATLVREFVEDPDREGEILGTSLLLSLLSSVFSILCIAGFVSVANWGEPITLAVCILYSLSLLFMSMELIQYWFHYKLQSKIPSIAMLTAYCVASAYKIYLLASGRNVYWFAIAYILEHGVVGILLLIIFRKQCRHRICGVAAMAKKLFSRSKYYILSSLMVTLFQNTDHIMLKILDSDAENGIYTAAITCAGVGSFIYAAIVDSMRPVILEEKKAGTANYENNISKLYCIVVYLSLLQGVAFALLAKPIIMILYGAEYLPSVPVLQVLIWYLSFSQMGRIRNIWILAEEKQAILWKINLTGALMNVIVNAVAIPIWGAVGAALASLITQFFTNCVLGFVIKPLRRNNTLLLKGIAPGYMINLLRDTWNSVLTKS